MDFAEFKEKMSADIEYLALHLRDHIFSAGRWFRPALKTAQLMIKV